MLADQAFDAILNTLSLSAPRSANAVTVALSWRRASNILIAEVEDELGTAEFFAKQFIDRHPHELAEHGYREWTRRYNPDQWPGLSARGRFLKELTGSLFVSEISDNSLALRPLRWSIDSNVILFPKLPNQQSVCDLLRSPDLSSSANAFHTLGDALGRLHTYSRREVRRFDLLSNTHFLDNFDDFAAHLGWVDTSIAQLSRLIPETHHISTILKQELGLSRRFIETNGSYRAFSPGDFCPDNIFIHGYKLTFLDFEYSSFRNMFLDIAAVLVPFPTCWCWLRPNEDSIKAFLNGYRKVVAAEWPELAEADKFWKCLMLAWAWWVFSAFLWDIETALDHDGSWGLASYRTRHVHQLNDFSVAARTVADCKVLAMIAKMLAEMIGTRWEIAPGMAPNNVPRVNWENVLSGT